MLKLLIKKFIFCLAELPDSLFCKSDNDIIIYDYIYPFQCSSSNQLFSSCQ
jgi:hypothetical protein